MGVSEEQTCMFGGQSSVVLRDILVNFSVDLVHKFSVKEEYFVSFS